MRLYEISKEAREQGLSDVEINSVTDDTREVKRGDIFVCIEGEKFDGHSKAAEMLEKGAAAVAVSRDMGLKQQIIVPNTRKYLAQLASAYYGNPTEKLKLVAATGTNGKSTIINVIRFMLEEMGHKTGSIGTIGYDVCGKVYEAHLTTPRQMDLYRYFAEMVENGAEYCVMEASSQALAQYRICSEQFECSVFTNLTQDHLDYHGTMENYYQAKKMLFDMSKRAVVNVDGDYGKRLAAELEIPTVTYSTEGKADYFAAGIKSRNSGISYWLSSKADEKAYHIDFRMPGRFNVANSMAAVAVCEQLGFDIEDCVKAVQKCTGVRGRSEVIYDGDFTVICDYAHTEDALRKILSTIRGFASHRIICLFGAAGERDDTKRKAMGETVAELADYAVVTSDNPRFEDPVKIIDQVMEGILLHDIPYSVYVDRLEAIKFALSKAEKGDVVVLCGKGHETYQVIGNDYQDFDEHKIVAEIMNK